MEILTPELILVISLNLDIKYIPKFARVCQLFRDVVMIDTGWKARVQAKYLAPSLPSCYSSWLDLYRRCLLVKIYESRIYKKFEQMSNITANPDLPLLTIPTPIQQITAGYNFAVVLDVYGTIWTCGDNYWGELGLGDYKISRDVFTPIPDFKAKNVFAGRTYCTAIDLEDHLWFWGKNILEGFIMIDETSRISKPRQISNIRAKKVMCGVSHIMIIDLDDNLWGLGTNQYGELGLGYYSKREDLILIPGIKPKDGAAHDLKTAIIDTDDNVWIFGNRVSPQKLDGIKAKQIAFHVCDMVILDMNGRILVRIETMTLPNEIPQEIIMLPQLTTIIGTFYILPWQENSLSTPISITIDPMNDAMLIIDNNCNVWKYENIVNNFDGAPPIFTKLNYRANRVVLGDNHIMIQS